MYGTEIFTPEKENNVRTITTLEIAEMMGVPHYEILKKLEGTTNPDGSTKQVGIIPTLGKLSTYFKYPEAVRRLIYTTNAIEGFNRQLWKVTKSKTVFPSDDSLLKMLYLATMDITKKWTGHRQDWGQIHSQLEIYFEERLAERNL